ncbi:MAG: hypothetical protein AABO58_17185 [Acidobacteriota bacterium]
MRALAGVVLSAAVALGIAYAVVEVAGDRETLVSPPDAIAEAFYRSIVTRRFEPAADLLSRRSDADRDALRALADEIARNDGRVTDVAAEIEERSADRARVTVTLRGERSEEKRDVDLVWEDDAWRVRRLDNGN